jgi:hypothetical protein
MNKPDQKQSVKAIRDYLASIGAPISSVQGYEVLARGLGFKNKHVMHAGSEPTSSMRVPGSAKKYMAVDVNNEMVPMFQETDGHYSVEQMNQLRWTFGVVIPVPIELWGDIEAKNSYVSEKITGNDCALEDIGYAHITSVNYSAGLVPTYVTGYVSSPKDFFPEIQEDEDKVFYGDLLALMSSIKVGAIFEQFKPSTRTSAHSRQKKVIRTVHANTQKLLWTYAKECGQNNEALRSLLDAPVFEAEADGVVSLFTVKALKYATRVGPKSWQVGHSELTDLLFLD